MNTTKSLPKAWEAIDTKLNKGSYNGSASDLKTLIDGKEPAINKKSGFNLDKSDAINSANSNTLATSTAVKTAYDKGLEGVNAANTKLTRGNLPAELTDSKSLYDLLENNGGLNMDPNLLYLNDAGEKTKGKVYFDKNKKGLFECIETTSSTTNSTTYFVDISNKTSSDRLNNLKLNNNELVINNLKFIFKKTTFTVPVYPKIGYSEVLINDFNKVIYMGCNALNAGPHMRYSLERTGKILATIAQGDQMNIEFMILIIENLL